MSASRPRGTRQHPVADNPLRLLHGTGWNAPGDLRRNARTLKLMALRGPIDPEEPGRELCPRRRTQEDYLSAERQLADGCSFACALTFTLHWPGPGEMPFRAANLALLEAEGTEPGDLRRSSLLAGALAHFGGPALEEWVPSVSGWAAAALAAPVDPAETLRRIKQELAAVIRENLPDAATRGQSLDLDFLDSIEALKGFPEIEGFERATEKLWERHLAELAEFQKRLAAANVILQTVGVDSGPTVASIPQFFEEAATVRRKVKTMRQRPLYRWKPEPPAVGLITHEMAMVAWIFGVRRGDWGTAARFADGLSPEAIVHNNELTRQCLKAVIHLAPAMLNMDPVLRPAKVRQIMVQFPLTAPLLAPLGMAGTRPPVPPSRPAAAEPRRTRARKPSASIKYPPPASVTPPRVVWLKGWLAALLRKAWGWAAGRTKSSVPAGATGLSPRRIYAVKPVLVTPSITLEQVPWELRTVFAPNALEFEAAVAGPSAGGKLGFRWLTDQASAPPPAPGTSRQIQINAEGGNRVISAVQRPLGFTGIVLTKTSSGHIVPPPRWIAATVRFPGVDQDSLVIWCQEMARRVGTSGSASGIVIFKGNNAVGVVLNLGQRTGGFYELVPILQFMQADEYQAADWGPVLSNADSATISQEKPHAGLSIFGIL